MDGLDLALGMVGFSGVKEEEGAWGFSRLSGGGAVRGRARQGWLPWSTVEEDGRQGGGGVCSGWQ